MSSGYFNNGQARTFTNRDFVLGKDIGDNALSLNGAIDNVYAFSKALTSSDVSYLYTSASPTFIPTATPTAVPTLIPTIEPTFNPTNNPTSVPTMSPTCTISLCSAGQYATSTSTCAVCAPGQYTSHTDRSSCSVCPAGSYANTAIGASACIQSPS